MPRYLDPKTDLVFKKIFGEHPHLLISFLNAVLPLEEGELIVSLEYLLSEQVPVIPIFKYTVVDVRCTDQKGRIFIVEMQIQWTASFMQRMLFNASKAYIKQLGKGEHYNLLKPVYGLGLINAEFDPNQDEWYHHYKIVNVKNPKMEIKDLQLVFIELPKFKTKNLPEKKLKVLWLRFLSELDKKTNDAPQEWLNVPEIKEAMALAEEAAYTEAELDAYDKYWDAISIEKTLITDSHMKGKTEGKTEGIAIGRKEGREEGREEGKEEGKKEMQYEMARTLLTEGFAAEKIAQITKLSLEKVLQLVK